MNQLFFNFQWDLIGDVLAVYSNVFLVIIIGFLILLLISYQFSIKKTVDLKDSVTVLNKEKELLSNASQRIFNLQQENKYLDSILQKKEISIENSFQQTLLQKLNSFQQTVPLEIISFSENSYPLGIKEAIKNDFKNIISSVINLLVLIILKTIILPILFLTILVYFTKRLLKV